MSGNSPWLDLEIFKDIFKGLKTLSAVDNFKFIKLINNLTDIFEVNCPVCNRNRPRSTRHSPAFNRLLSGPCPASFVFAAACGGSAGGRAGRHRGGGSLGIAPPATTAARRLVGWSVQLLPGLAVRLGALLSAS